MMRHEFTAAMDASGYTAPAECCRCGVTAPMRYRGERLYACEECGAVTQQPIMPHTSAGQ